MLRDWWVICDHLAPLHRLRLRRAIRLQLHPHRAQRRSKDEPPRVIATPLPTGSSSRGVGYYDERTRRSWPAHRLGREARRGHVRRRIRYYYVERLKCRCAVQAHPRSLAVASCAISPWCAAGPRFPSKAQRPRCVGWTRNRTAPDRDGAARLRDGAREYDPPTTGRPVVRAGKPVSNTACPALPPLLGRIRSVVRGEEIGLEAYRLTKSLVLWGVSCRGMYTFRQCFGWRTSNGARRAHFDSSERSRAMKARGIVTTGGYDPTTRSLSEFVRGRELETAAPVTNGLGTASALCGRALSSWPTAGACRPAIGLLPTMWRFAASSSAP
jgi:hypothetical protein